MRKKKRLLYLLVIPLAILLIIGIYQIPAINQRLAWRVDALRAEIKYALNPPEEEVFIPGEEHATATPADTATPEPTEQPATPTKAGPTETLMPTATATMTTTPLPESVTLTGITHEYQAWNNCGPSNLSMALSYWDWPGDQYVTEDFLKPNRRDKNVMPYEMVAFVNEQTDLKALWRVGGDLELLKRFVAAGFPVLVEKGFEADRFDGWMGHYEVVNGYDDSRQRFLTQDSYIMSNFPVSYEDMQTYWQHFNYTYIVIYPPEREAEVMDLLGPYQDETYAYRAAAEKASNEIFTLTGRAKAFAWFNRGTNLVYLDDYAGAAEAYDEYFLIYASLDGEQVNIPWRAVWYQTGPYWAYYYTGRYYDVINLATTTIETASEPAIEETWYWRGLAREALGDIDGAIADLRKAVELNPNFDVGRFHLERIQGG